MLYYEYLKVSVDETKSFTTPKVHRVTQAIARDLQSKYQMKNIFGILQNSAIFSFCRCHRMHMQSRPNFMHLASYLLSNTSTWKTVKMWQLLKCRRVEVCLGSVVFPLAWGFTAVPVTTL